VIINNIVKIKDGIGLPMSYGIIKEIGPKKEYYMVSPLFNYPRHQNPQDWPKNGHVTQEELNAKGVYCCKPDEISYYMDASHPLNSSNPSPINSSLEGEAFL